MFGIGIGLLSTQSGHCWGGAEWAIGIGVDACVRVLRPLGSSFTSLQHPPQCQRLRAALAQSFPPTTVAHYEPGLRAVWRFAQ